MKKMIGCLLVALLSISPLPALSFSGSQSYNVGSPSLGISWKNMQLGDKYRYMIYDDKWIGVSIKVPHYPQPNDYTCGAANLAMAKSWNHFVDTGTMPSKPNINAIYDLADTDGNSGLTATEMKNAIGSIVGLPHREYGWDTIEQALRHYKWTTHLLRSSYPVPAIVYGNTVNGPAGGHYYSMTGVLHCEEHCNSSYNGAYLMDSVHGSPAYKDKRPDRSDYPSGMQGFMQWSVDQVMWAGGFGPAYTNILPGRFLTSAALADYWGKTGASLPWNKKHYYLALSDAN